MFTAGSLEDPRRGYGLCLNCSRRIVHFQEATGLWVDDLGKRHTGHEIELAQEPLGKQRDKTKGSSKSQPEPIMPSQSSVLGLSPLLAYVVTRYQLTGLVGEEKNIAHLFLTCTTRHLKPKYRRHVVTQGETGAGKTTLIRKVLQPFWKDVERHTRVTGPGLDRKEESLDGKILFLEQLIGSEPTQLKFLMTEGELSILVAERDKETGRVVSRIHRLKGMPVVISTLVGAEIDPQFLSRVSTLEIDESDDQTKAIIHKKLEEWSTVSSEEEWKVYGPLTWLDAKCCELGPYVEAVKIPFAKQLESGLPPTLSMRRGVDRILNLVAAIAFVKAAIGLRPLVEVKPIENVKQVYVVALPEDLDDALFCVGEKLVESVSYFFGRAKEVYDHLLKNSEENKSSDVAVALKMSQNRASEYLRLLAKLGHVTRTRQGREWCYFAVSGCQLELKLNATLTNVELSHWFSENFTEGSTELVLPKDMTLGPAKPPLPVPVGSSSNPKDDTLTQIVPTEATIPTIVPKPTSKDHDTGTRQGHSHDLLHRAAAALTKEKGLATIDDLEKMLSGKVSSNEIYRWMDVIVDEGLAERLDWGRWRTVGP